MNPNTPAPTALPKDYSDLVTLLDELTSVTNDLGALETELNAAHLANVRLHVDRYKDLQTRIGAAEAAIAVIAARNPQWFGEKKSLETPFGVVKRTTSTSLVIADETATIALIRAAKREDDFLVIETHVRREALELLEDHELKKYGVRRETKHNYKPAAASVDLGKSVKAAEKTDKAAKGTVRKAAAAVAGVLFAVLLFVGAGPRATATDAPVILHGVSAGELRDEANVYRALEKGFERFDFAITSYFRGHAEAREEIARRLDVLSLAFPAPAPASGGGGRPMPVRTEVRDERP